MKYSNEKKEEAKLLRSEGKSNSEIANTLAIPRRTIIRWVKTTPKGGGDTNGDISLLNDRSDEKNVNSTIKNEVNKETNHTSFSGTNVTFDTKTGGFTLEHTAEKIEVQAMPARELAGETDTSAVNTEVKAGGGQQFQTEHVTEKPDINAPENVMDKFFTRDMGENLLLVGMLTAGFMLKGRLGEKGEFREQTEGGAW